MGQEGYLSCQVVTISRDLGRPVPRGWEGAGAGGAGREREQVLHRRGQGPGAGREGLRQARPQPLREQLWGLKSQGPSPAVRKGSGCDESRGGQGEESAGLSLRAVAGVAWEGPASSESYMEALPRTV